ncbi:hypothetical protein A0H81_09261 [Grifola frondosa]|uniref:Uncharacterized protein n=1 Tax=Grifola frondosa TaxID=5627 RepID=A0A1C7M1I2_GRIFR|nr:hypothetical protein A0H81_09261 [Grifola frondosa]
MKVPRITTFMTNHKRLRATNSKRVEINLGYGGVAGMAKLQGASSGPRVPPGSSDGEIEPPDGGFEWPSATGRRVDDSNCPHFSMRR